MDGTVSALWKSFLFLIAMKRSVSEEEDLMTLSSEGLSESLANCSDQDLDICLIN